MISKKLVTSSVDYNPETGKFTVAPRSDHSIQWNLENVGKPAGQVDADGNLLIEIKGELFPAHHIAFMYVLGRWPGPHIHHANGDKLDNRWDNLSEARQFAPIVAPICAPVRDIRSPEKPIAPKCKSEKQITQKPPKPARPTVKPIKPKRKSEKLFVPKPSKPARPTVKPIKPKRKGVSWIHSRGSWRAHIEIHKKQHSRSFVTFEDACEWRNELEKLALQTELTTIQLETKRIDETKRVGVYKQSRNLKKWIAYINRNGKFYSRTCETFQEACDVRARWEYEFCSDALNRLGTSNTTCIPGGVA